MSENEVSDGERNSLSALRALAGSSRKLTYRKLWSALTVEEKTEAAGRLLSLDYVRDLFEQFNYDADDLTDEFLNNTVVEHRTYVVVVVTNATRYRPSTVKKMTDEQLVKIFSNADLLPLSRSTVPKLLFAALHMFGRIEMVRGFLDGLNIPHQNGFINAEDVKDLKRSPAEINNALFLAQKRSEGLGDRWVLTWALYFLLFAESGFASELRAHLAERCENNDPIGDHGRAVDTDEIARRRIGLLDGQTIVDRVVITEIVATRSGIDGALSPDDADELVNEVLASNISHQQRYYHRGFYDALFEQSFDPSGLEFNDTRRRWYWAGAVVGLKRTDKDQKILELYDAHETIRGFGDGKDGASQGTVRLMVEVLATFNREGEINVFLPGRLVFIKWGSGLFHDVLTIAKQLLRTDRVREAKQLFDRLANVVDVVEEVDLSTEKGTWRTDVERRQAQCLQRNGDFVAAKRLTQRLLEGQTDETLSGKLHADLGLINGKLRSLADVRLPASKDKRRSFASALRKGLPQFEEAEAYQAEHRAHADLCLGVLLLNEEHYDKAAARLDNARAAFLTDRDAYNYGQIIERTELYLGIAIFGAMVEGRFDEASRMIHKPVKSGVVFPYYLLPKTIEHMELGGFGIEAGVLGDMVLQQASDMERDELLDELRQCEAKRAVTSLAKYFRQRAVAPTRSKQQQVSDCYEALPLLLGTETGVGEATGVLDQLEQFAVEGIEPQKFCDLLENGTCDQVWARDEALAIHVHVLRAQGRNEQAGQLLQDGFHRVLTEGEHGIAEGLLEDMRLLGLEVEVTDPLKKRLDSALTADMPSTEHVTADAKPVKVLFVGGDESYAKFDDAFRDTLHGQDPAIDVEFIRSRWTSNWDVYLEEFKRKVTAVDGVVVTRYIRTEFGKSIRKAIPAGMPWQGCWKPSTGQGIRAILTVAHFVRN